MNSEEEFAYNLALGRKVTARMGHRWFVRRAGATYFRPGSADTAFEVQFTSAEWTPDGLPAVEARLRALATAWEGVA